MPYASTADLPESVRERYHAKCQRAFMEAYNGADGDEGQRMAIAHTAAQRCMESNKALKFVGPDTVEGLAIPFGSPDDRDLDGEYFTKGTDFALDWFPTGGRPSLYHHGFDDALKLSVVGRQVEHEVHDEGIWAQVQLDRAARYRKTIDRLVEEGALGYSSGSIGHLASKSAEGAITVWPWVELSLTPTPANPRTGIHYVKASTAIEHVLEVESDTAPIVKAVLAAIDDNDSSPAGEPFATHSDRVLAEVKALADRARSIREVRAKSGRVLSSANRARLQALIEAWEPSLAELRTLLAETDPEHKAQVEEAIAKALRTYAATALLRPR